MEESEEEKKIVTRNILIRLFFILMAYILTKL